MNLWKFDAEPGGCSFRAAKLENRYPYPVDRALPSRFLEEHLKTRAKILGVDESLQSCRCRHHIYLPLAIYQPRVLRRKRMFC